MNKQVLVSTREGRYVWWPRIYLVEFIPKGKRTPVEVFHCRFTPVPHEREALKVIMEREGLKLHPNKTSYG